MRKQLRAKQGRVPVVPGSPPAKAPTIFDGVTSGTKKQRLTKAIRNDNGGQWFLAESRHTVAQLEKRFQAEAVAAVLFERIGGMLKGPFNYIYIQIELVTDVIDRYNAEGEPVWKRVRSYNDDERWPEWAVEVGLKDIGVEIIEAVLDIRTVLKSGLY